MNQYSRESGGRAVACSADGWPFSAGTGTCCSLIPSCVHGEYPHYLALLRNLYGLRGGPIGENERAERAEFGRRHRSPCYEASVFSILCYIGQRCVASCRTGPHRPAVSRASKTAVACGAQRHGKLCSDCGAPFHTRDEDSTAVAEIWPTESFWRLFSNGGRATGDVTVGSLPG
jgi:hypothetical protein